jgi:hypothetical protein
VQNGSAAPVQHTLSFSASAQSSGLAAGSTPGGQYSRTGWKGCAVGAYSGKRTMSCAAGRGARGARHPGPLAPDDTP